MTIFKTKQAALAVIFGLLSTTSVTTLHANEIERIRPNGAGYSQVVVAKGSTIVSVAGTTALDASFKVIGKGDLSAQTAHIFSVIESSLKEAGASSADVVRIRFWVRDFKTSDWEKIQPHFKKFSKGNPPVSTLIGVQTLFTEDLLIEIDVTAVID